MTPKRVEAAWNETLNSLTGVPEGAGGGGISQVFPMPSWQKGPRSREQLQQREPL